MTVVGFLSDYPYPLASYSPGVIVNGDLYFMRFRSLSRLDLDELVFKDVSAEAPPFIPPGNDTGRTSMAMFSPRNQDGIIYVAAGNDDTETIHYHSTWAYEIRQMQWTQKASHDFYASFPQSECSLDRCYVQGGASNITMVEEIYNSFYEYDHQKDAWKNCTDSDAAYTFGNGFKYLPHMDALVSFGGIGRPSGSNPGTRITLNQVSLFHISNSTWVHYWDPPHMGDMIPPVVDPYAPLLPLSAVYNDAIYIATGKLPAPSRLMKITFDEPVPTYHHIIFENDGFIPSFSRGQIGGLIGDHFLVIGGGWSSLISTPITALLGVGLLSLC